MRGRNHQIKAAIVGAHEQKFRSIFASKTACISCVRAAADASLSGRTAQIAQLHSAGSSVNSVEKPAGFYEELTQKTEPKFVKTSSVFFENGDFLRAGFATTHSKNRGLPRQNRRIICDFSSKKAVTTPPEMRWDGTASKEGWMALTSGTVLGISR